MAIPSSILAWRIPMDRGTWWPTVYGVTRVEHDLASKPPPRKEKKYYVESEEELKSLLMKVKEESGKSWLKTQYSENEDHGFWSHHFVGNRWGNSGNSVRLSFWGLQNHYRW